MLIITTDNNSIKAERNGSTLFVVAKNAVSYRYDSARVLLYPPDTVCISESFSKGVTMNGTPITADNIEAEFADFFEVQGGGGVTDHTLLTNRDAADQHPISAITGLTASLQALAAMQGNWLGVDFPTYADLLAYDASLAEKPADKTWTRVHADENPLGGNGNPSVYAWLRSEISPDTFENILTFQYAVYIPDTEIDPVFTAWKGDTSVRAGAGSSTAGPYS
ncbi:hypothetical protein ACFO6W_00020, partial [Dysgonomonas termitidis]